MLFPQVLFWSPRAEMSFGRDGAVTPRSTGETARWPSEWMAGVPETRRQAQTPIKMPDSRFTFRAPLTPRPPGGPELPIPGSRHQRGSARAAERPAPTGGAVAFKGHPYKGPKKHAEGRILCKGPSCPTVLATAILASLVSGTCAPRERRLCGATVHFLRGLSVNFPCDPDVFAPGSSWGSRNDLPLLRCDAAFLKPLRERGAHRRGGTFVGQPTGSCCVETAALAAPGSAQASGLGFPPP